MATVIYNCKRCKVGRRVEYPIRVQAYPQSYYERKDEAGRRVSQGVWVNRSGGGKPTLYGGDPLGLCPQCGHAMTYGVLEGRVSADVPCDARCTNARGHTCDCSCGGKNHGAGWQIGKQFSQLVAA